MKKLFTLLLAVLMLIGTISACGGNTDGVPSTNDPGAPSSPGGDSSSDNSTPNPSSDGREHFEISIAMWDIGNSFPGDGSPDAALDYLEERFNVTLVPVNVSWADDITSIVTNWAVAGTLPDVTGCLSMPGTAMYRQWIDDGVIRSIPQSIYSKYSTVNKLMNDPSVEIHQYEDEAWFLPRATYANPDYYVMNKGIINRKDWREKLGFDVPKTTQDFLDLLTAYATLDPKGDGSYTTGLTFDQAFFAYEHVFSSFGYIDNEWGRNENGEVVNFLLEKTALPLFSFYRELNRRGAIDPDFIGNISNTESAGATKFIASQAGMLAIEPAPNHLCFTFTQLLTLQNDEGGDILDYIEILDPPTDGGLWPPIGFRGDAFWSENYIRADISDEKLDRIVELFDFLASEEGMNFVWFGFEGQDWQFRVDGSVELLTPIDADTKTNMPAGALYPVLNGGINRWASWYGDIQYFNPAYPAHVMKYCADIRDQRIRDWTPRSFDYKINTMTVFERDVFDVAGEGLNGWASFIFDTSNTPDEDLFDRIYANWLASGYQAAKNAMTKMANELGF